MTANDNEGPFSLGQNVWPGIAKLSEESGEVIQVIGKLIATGGRTDHWSGLDLQRALIEEMGDVRAALHFVAIHNDLDQDAIRQRMVDKLALFEEWHAASGDSEGAS